MSEPKREQVMVAVAERLRGISVDNGFVTSPKLVTRHLLPLTSYNEYPILGIGPGTGSLMTLAAQREAYLDQFVFGVWGYVSGNDAVSAGTWIARLADDVATRLLQQPGLGLDFVQGLTPGRMDVDEEIVAPLGAFRWTWTATMIQTYRVAA